jgi:hypothetical protein
LPVEIWLWVVAISLLMDFRVCSATMAPLFVRMLDIFCPCFYGVFTPKKSAARGVSDVFLTDAGKVAAPFNCECKDTIAPKK